MIDQTIKNNIKSETQISEMTLYGKVLIYKIALFKHKISHSKTGDNTWFTTANTASISTSKVPKYIIKVTNGTATIPLSIKYIGNWWKKYIVKGKIKICAAIDTFIKSQMKPNGLFGGVQSCFIFGWKYKILNNEINENWNDVWNKYSGLYISIAMAATDKRLYVLVFLKKFLPMIYKLTMDPALTTEGDIPVSTT